MMRLTILLPLLSCTGGSGGLCATDDTVLHSDTATQMGLARRPVLEVFVEARLLGPIGLDDETSSLVRVYNRGEAAMGIGEIEITTGHGVGGVSLEGYESHPFRVDGFALSDEARHESGAAAWVVEAGEYLQFEVFFSPGWEGLQSMMLGIELVDDDLDAAVYADLDQTLHQVRFDGVGEATGLRDADWRLLGIRLPQTEFTPGQQLLGVVELSPPDAEVESLGAVTYTTATGDEELAVTDRVFFLEVPDEATQGKLFVEVADDDDNTQWDFENFTVHEAGELDALVPMWPE